MVPVYCAEIRIFLEITSVKGSLEESPVGRGDVFALEESTFQD